MCFQTKKLVNGLQKQERAMSGYDVKLSGQAPYLPWAKSKALIITGTLQRVQTLRVTFWAWILSLPHQ
ncbi:hypothetical protein BSPWISOXPB_10189 [uncultured Gammaproteobacteria bacterium]|nr:hypothetical protein BSPWISOXPB_10189 [uncultured Gammaproteobacteria bacterium]